MRKRVAAEDAEDEEDEEEDEDEEESPRKTAKPSSKLPIARSKESSTSIAALRKELEATQDKLAASQREVDKLQRRPETVPATQAGEDEGVFERGSAHTPLTPDDHGEWLAITPIQGLELISAISCHAL